MINDYVENIKQIEFPSISFLQSTSPITEEGKEANDNYWEKKETE
jgi:hypothetical protein